MKKIISVILTVCFAAQMGFAAVAAETKPIYELNIEGEAGGKLEKDVTNVTETATAVIGEDEEGKYIAVRDDDLSVDFQYGPTTNFDGVKTVSFDLRTINESKHAPMLYLDMAICLTLAKSPTHYNGGTVKTTGTLTPGEWINITLVTDAASKTFDLYTDGLCIAENFSTRDGRSIGGDMRIKLMGKPDISTHFDFKNFKIYDGEVVPPLSDKIKDTLLNPERNLVDYANAEARLDSVLGNAVAMTVGNSMARVNNNYVPIDPDNEYVAPFITADGYTLIPTRFTTETIGCTVEVLSSTSFRFSKDGTVMEINMGDQNAIINGVPAQMPTTPVIKNDRLFIPLRFAAETYGKNVFWDDRGLIIISDGEVVKTGQEDIIKPLINEIRSYTTIFGNKKYSDVNYSARFYREDGYDGGQWGALDAAKRFMATVNRWTYVVSGDNVKAYKDQGLLQQGSLNANTVGEYAKLDSPLNATTYFLSGTPYQRADMVHGPNWGCVNNPMFMEEVKVDAKLGIDNGLFAWQFDDWALNTNYRLGGCHCKWCNDGFKNYLKNDASTEEIESLKAQGITDVSDFDYVEWLKSQGITHENQYTQIADTPIDLVRQSFMRKQVRKFNAELIEFMNEYNGSDIFYSINFNDTLETYANDKFAYMNDIVEGLMGETHSQNTTPEAIYATMLVSRAIDVENVISPLPKNEVDAALMYSAIPMTYATGQFMLVPWDDWLYGTTRYYATLEELGGTFEFPREYPFLFDNYEIPEAIGYVFDLNETPVITQYAGELLEKGIPARALIHRDAELADYSFDTNKLKGLQAIVATGELPNLTAEEKAAIENSGIVFVKADDTASIEWLENTYHTVRDTNPDVHTVLRQNKLYDNAPVVVHAVNYNNGVRQSNVEVEINNLWLPEGDTFTVNVYKPGENYKTIKAVRGNGTTKITIDYVDRWTVLEICGTNTVRREVAFDIGEGYNGIGTGTRISKDKAYGNKDDFTIVTYSEGINSTTFNDTTGTQDEIAFVYKRLANSVLRKSFVSAGLAADSGAYGVMVRDGLYSNARFAALMYDSQNGLRLAKRGITNKAVVYTELGNTKPAYMKLQHEDEDYVAYVSDDNVNFTEAGRIKINFDAPVGGVFATSANGSRNECRVTGMNIADGGFESDTFKYFKIKYPGNAIEMGKTGKLEAEIETANYPKLQFKDVSMSFASSNENVLKVAEDGTLVPISEGKATITATARMGMKSINSTLDMTVKPVNPVMFEENFDSDKWPAYLVHSTAGTPEVKDGALKARTAVDGQECDMTFSFVQRNKPVVFEFDFKAKFGKKSPTTGARVIYANGAKGLSLTADPNGFNWFFGNEQTHVADIEENKWYHIRVEADYDLQLANVWIDDELVVSRGEPRTNVSPNGSVQVGAWRLGTDSCYEWDNFKIYFVDSIK